MNDELRTRIEEKCRQLDIPVVGFASAKAWDKPPFEPWVPKEFRPASIYPEAKSVIVIGLPITLPILETSPSIYYHVLYQNVNQMLDEHAYRIATWLSEMGHASIYLPRDGYGTISILKDKPITFFSHRHAAYLAGLGTFGVNNMILTTRYGPRVRFTSIFTTAELPSNPPIKEELCTRCMRCSDSCPVKALPEDGYPLGLTDKKACATRAEDLYQKFRSPCGICIKVCPVGDDRRLYSREDADMYGDAKGYAEYHRAWDHVRSYGSR
ncbi:MAG: 4Fe-4S binding protein [Methanomassiliicoccales archaeon]|nr:4Fe-4S binding protein [Methanomassiliicoccales archaeon]